MKKIKNGFIIDGYFDYPPVFLILLSFFSKKTLFRIQGFISPFFDALLNIALFFIVLHLSGDITLALLAQLIYTCIPVAALENSALLPRSLGYSFFMLSFFFLIMFTAGGNKEFGYLGISILFATLTLLTHKFATQSYFFISVFFTLFEKNAYYIGTLGVGMLLAIIVSKGYYLRVLKSHINIIAFWIKNKKNRFSQVYGNITTTKNPDLIGIIYKLLIKLAPFTLLSGNPWILSAFLLLFFHPVNLPPVLFKMAIWVIFFYVFGIIVLMIPKLTPIGEGYRYMEMSTLPSAILSSYMFIELLNSTYGIWALSIFSFFLLATFFVIIFVQKKAVISDKNRSLTNDMQQMFSYINTLPETPRIMCIPHQITTMVVYNTKADILVNFDGLEKEKGDD